MTVIREATPADAAVLDAMVRELAAHEGDLAHVHVDAAAWSELLARPDVRVLIAEDESGAIGFTSTVRRIHLWTGGDLLALDDLYVRPDHRDKGVGSRLMTAVARLAAEDDLLVQWGVRLDNHAGQRFYARLGATLNTKMTASWAPAQYRRHLATTR
ncbi:N-acetyltransferase family protein [Microbacterium sp. F51-2R]|jgi:GNAT superfamily N-acetyltransferase|uniref:GNAT family N-acetyltransferase n=1 Tax=Microbacterium sp. F51-2R TaxID=3445777 RepID=UPI003F9FBE7D